MNVDRFKIVRVAILCLAALFIVGVVLGNTLISSIAKAFIFPIYLYLYLVESERKSKSFTGFLFIFSVAGLYAVVVAFRSNIYSHIGSLPYIAAYMCLLIYMIRSMNFKTLIKRFKYYLIVLMLFSGYIIFTLNSMVLEDESLKVNTLEFVFEGLYNFCILLVLSFSLLYYLYHDSRRGFLLFLASACIVFSEMVQVAYIFIAADYVLNVIYSLLLIVGFYFIYMHIESKIYSENYKALR